MSLNCMEKCDFWMNKSISHCTVGVRRDCSRKWGTLVLVFLVGSTRCVWGNLNVGTCGHSFSLIRMREETCCYFSGVRFNFLVSVEISEEGEDKEYTHQALKK